MADQTMLGLFHEKKPMRLTVRQQEILLVIQRAIANTGAPPTRAEIAAEMGFRSANAAEEHLQALARKGAIELVSGTSRGIRLPKEQKLSESWNPSPISVPNFASKLSKSVAQMSKALATLELPLIGRVAAGNPILAQEHIDKTYHLEAQLFLQQPDFLLRVRGLSMRDAGIMDGDLLAVKKASEAKNGQIVVARLGDEVTVKRFYRYNEGLIELKAENPDFQTIIVKPGQPFEIEGWAVGLIRDSFSH